MTFPTEIERVLAGYEVEPQEGPRTARATAPGRPTLWVKTDVGLAPEAERLRWLAGRLPVPEVVAFVPGEAEKSDEPVDHLVTTHVAGVPASSRDHQGDVGPMLAAVAEGLRQFHDLPVVECPYDESLTVEVQKAWAAVLAGVGDRAAFDRALPLTPTSEDLVVTHGDYCLPNVLVAGGRVTGFVDVGMVGRADRHRDFGSVTRSITRNWGEEWVAPFFVAYGRDPDPAWLAFCHALDRVWPPD